MGNILAISFSPTSLTYNLKTNQENCQVITLISNSDKIEVYDKWASSKDVEWQVSSFNTDALSHGISIKHLDTLSIDQRKVEVCISGSKEGEYHGVLLLKEEQKGNSIMQMGIWMTVLIKNTVVQPSTPEKTTTQPQNITTTSSENTNSNSNAQVQLTVDQNKQDSAKQQEIIIQKNQEKTTASPITGAAVGTGSRGVSILTIIVILFVIGALIALFNYRRIQRRKMEYGY